MMYWNSDKMVSLCFLEVNDTLAEPAAEKEEKDEQSEDQGVPDLTNFRVEELRRCVSQTELTVH